MPKPKAHDCHDCEHHLWKGTTLTCQKGHKPRFYMPNSPMPTNQWGWKRCCSDFTFTPYTNSEQPE